MQHDVVGDDKKLCVEAGTTRHKSGDDRAMRSFW